MKLGLWEKIGRYPKHTEEWHYDYVPQWVKDASEDYRRVSARRSGEYALYNGDSFQYKVWDNDETIIFYLRLRQGLLSRFLGAIRSR